MARWHNAHRTAVAVRFAACAVVVTGLGWVLPAAAEAAPTCRGVPATIVGEDRSEVLTGTAGRDVVAAGGGNDTVYGRGGNDLICGGRGTDRLNGGRGDDRLYGDLDGFFIDTAEDRTELLGDTLRGGPGADLLRPGHDSRTADDVIRDALVWDTASRGVDIDLSVGRASGQGHDRFTPLDVSVVGSAYSDTIIGSNQDDRIFAGSGSDAVSAGAGADTVYADDSPTARSADATDVVLGGRGPDYLEASVGEDRLIGGRGADFLADAGDSGDVLEGGSGADSMVGEIADTDAEQRYSGGDGVDRISLFSNHINPTPSPASAEWNMASGRLVYTLDEPVTLVVEDFEEGDLSTFGSTTWTVRGTGGDDVISAGGTGPTTFYGLAGDDQMLGSSNDDTFDGGPGHDTSQGMGAGDDTCISVETFDLDGCEHSS